MPEIVAHCKIVMTVAYICMYQFGLYALGFTKLAQCVDDAINQSIKSNILFVKIIQALTSTTLLPPEVIDIFKRNTHSVAIDEDEIDNVLLSRIQRDYEIRTIQPFHSGMVSIVYIGEKDGRKVVIKLKRKDIAKRIANGSDNINFVYDCLHRLLVFSPDLQAKLNSMNSITKTAEYLISQCDFENEINALITTAMEIREFPICENIVIPAVYNKPGDIPNAEFIVMEHLSGEFPDRITCDEQRKRYMYLFLAFTMTQGWFTTFYHTDLHNGNVLCMTDASGNRRLGVIDFGMNMKLTSDMKESMQRMSQTLCKIHLQTGEAVMSDIKARDYVNLVLAEKIDVDTFTDEQQAAIDEAMNTILTALSDGTLAEYHINQTFDVLKNRLGVDLILNMEMVLMLISLSMGNSTLRILANNDETAIRENIRDVMKEFVN